MPKPTVFYLEQGYWWISFLGITIDSGTARTYQEAKEAATEAWIAFRIKLLTTNLEFGR